MRHWMNLLEQAFGTTQTLFHGTDLDSLLGIWKSGVIDPDHEGREYAGPVGVSMTRSFKVAKEFAEQRTRDNFLEQVIEWFDLDDIANLTGCVFEFDRSHITNEIVAFDDFSDHEDDALGGEGREEEERAIGKMTLAGLVAIYCDRQNLIDLKKQINQRLDDDNVDRFARVYFPVIDDILASSLVRPIGG